jgi:hypothetical protein
MNETFKKLLWRCGFVVNFGGTLHIDKQSAEKYLYCSRRTLNRWLDNNDPCPRAVALLKLHEQKIPDSWSGFYFDRQERLNWTGTNNGYNAQEVRQLPIFHAQKQSAANERDNLQGLLDEIRDKNAHIITKDKLLQAVNILHEAISDPIFHNLPKLQKRG